MTYTEIEKKSGDGDLETTTLTRPEQQAYKIIELLLKRKGFEYWWRVEAGGMLPEINDEIFTAITKILSRD